MCMDFQKIMETFTERRQLLENIKNNYFKETGYTQHDLNIDDGIYGEYLTYEYLQLTARYSKTVCNLYIKRDSGYVSEIDIVFIHETGIYVIESKNYSGWIYGNENHQNWTQVLKNGEKFKFYNPLKQNKTHINALKEVLYAIPTEDFINLIVFSERCELKEIIYDNLRTSVINRDLISTFMSYESKHSPKIYNKKEIDYLYSMLKQYSLASPTIKEKHKKQSNY